MSRKRRTIDKQRKQSAKAKQKAQKRAYYASNQATIDWEEKKARKSQSQINKKASMGISTKCPLPEWESPSHERCEGCTLKCSYNRQ